MLSLIAAAVCLIGSVLTQTPPSYTLAETNKTLGLSYGSVSVKAGETLPYRVPTFAPTLSTISPLNETYIAIIVDTTANLSSPIPADLVWFQQDVTFSAAGIGSANSTAQVPYQSPTSVGHAYLALIYTQPPGFAIPANFPYSDTFRLAFNVTRVGSDFHTPLLAANWFVLGSNCPAPSYTASSGYGFATHGPFAKKAVYTNGAAGRY
ncbi:MAG: hypothetical protein ALECFALPRED_000653 [Alectoria fallacina]|uniref:Uncharacterized protein n=1 Tax=Alectoria fallacina TaxID=1903189 RepID=A0A8H3JA57_9LECA|nr:MAG: hypothetical protein ALECFALPRED_000653 [Alectoria fallacina]